MSFDCLNECQYKIPSSIRPGAERVLVKYCERSNGLNNTHKYLVSWKSFRTKDNSWELKANLKNYAEVIHELDSRFLEAHSINRRMGRKK